MISRIIRQVQITTNSDQDRIDGKKNDCLIIWRLWLTSIIFIAVLICEEWLFLVTKPTFDVRVQIIDKVSFLFFTIGSLSLILSVIFFIIILLKNIFHNTRWSSLVLAFGFFYPTLVVSLLFMMLLDNFTYTVLKFGILTSTNFLRVIYLLLIILVGFCEYKYLRKNIRQKIENLDTNIYLRRIQTTILSTVICALILIGIQYKTYELNSGRTKPPILIDRPNIILVTADGLNADNMSVYGYYRETTPNILELSKRSLIAMNAFTNASDSQGSIISILTGKLPMETRVLYSPDILMGDDAFDHLPGLLHDAGYSTFQFGDPFYVDASVANMIGGFDYVNNSKSFGSTWYFLNKHFPPQHQVFIKNLYQRISDRITHLFWLDNIHNPGDFLSGKPPYLFDIEKVDTIKSILETEPGPVFIHLHMLGTHGPSFNIENPVFSDSHPPYRNWDVDYYDDSILEFDSLIGELIGFLKENNLTNTIFIIGSDHGQRWSSTLRIPLIICFPDQSLNYRVNTNAQNIDIYPTILDYLGMIDAYHGDGRSLLQEIPDNRSIISIGVNTLSVTEEGRISFRPDKLKPPFFQFGYVNLIHCDEWYKVNLDDYTLERGYVENSKNSCDSSQKIGMNQAIEIIIEYLNQNGFDTTSLNEKFSIDE